MKWLVTFIGYWNRQVKKFDIFDVKCIQGVSMAFALIVAKLFPALTTISVWWFVGFGVLCLVKPAYALSSRTDRRSGGTPA